MLDTAFSQAEIMVFIFLFQTFKHRTVVNTQISISFPLTRHLLNPSVTDKFRLLWHPDGKQSSNCN